MAIAIDLEDDEPLYIVTWEHTSDLDYVRSNDLENIKEFYRSIDDAYGAELWIINPEDDVPVLMSSRKQVPSKEWNGPEID